MRITDKRKNLSKVAICAATIGIGVTAYFYLVYPPDFFYGRLHFGWSEDSFSQLAQVFDDNPTIDEIDIDPISEVNIQVSGSASSAKFTDEELAELLELFRATKVYDAKRGDDHIGFDAGTESKLGRHFQIRVIRQAGIQADVVDKKIAACADIVIFRMPQGACLDIRNENWAIFYLWTED